MSIHFDYAVYVDIDNHSLCWQKMKRVFRSALTIALYVSSSTAASSAPFPSTRSLPVSSPALDLSSLLHASYFRSVSCQQGSVQRNQSGTRICRFHLFSHHPPSRRRQLHRLTQTSITINAANENDVINVFNEFCWLPLCFVLLSVWNCFTYFK